MLSMPETRQRGAIWEFGGELLAEAAAHEEMLPDAEAQLSRALVTEGLIKDDGESARWSPANLMMSAFVIFMGRRSPRSNLLLAIVSNCRRKMLNFAISAGLSSAAPSIS
jgi:hypothetical protein